MTSYNFGGQSAVAGRTDVRKQLGSRPEVSVVVPCFNEEDALPETTRRLALSLEQMGLSFEIIFVDDASTDSSLRVVKEFPRADPRLRGISFSRNVLHQLPDA